MQAEAKITSKGQVTIPQAIRQALRAKEGDTLVFEADERGARVHVRHAASFAQYAGVLREDGGDTVEDIVAEIREMRGE